MSPSPRRSGRRRLALAASLLIAVLVHAAAIAAEGGPGPPPEFGTSRAETARSTFSWLRRNVFSMCMYCHISVPGVTLDTFDGVRRHVVPGDPGASRLYIMVVTRQMPKGRGGLPEHEIAAIRDWILRGAPDD